MDPGKYGSIKNGLLNADTDPDTDPDSVPVGFLLCQKFKRILEKCSIFLKYLMVKYVPI